MGQNPSTSKVRGIPHSQSEFQMECCLKYLVLRRKTFLNYCSILFSVLDKCTLALFTACLECYCKDNFPIHHLEHITHPHSPPIATFSPPQTQAPSLLFCGSSQLLPTLVNIFQAVQGHCLHLWLVRAAHLWLPAFQLYLCFLPFCFTKLRYYYEHWLQGQGKCLQNPTPYPELSTAQVLMHFSSCTVCSLHA